MLMVAADCKQSEHQIESDVCGVSKEIAMALVTETSHEEYNLHCGEEGF